jgi:hypothetical protein
MYQLYWNRLKVILGITALTTAYACSSKQAIDSSAIDITNQASESLVLANEIVKTTGERLTAVKAETIAEKQENIITEASNIRTSLHGVTDTTPWWARLLQQMSIAAIIIGTIILLWQTGIGLFVKKILWSVGWLIPKRAIRSAAVDMKATDPENPLSFRESIAVRRASDPAYEYARKKLQKEI